MLIIAVSAFTPKSYKCYNVKAKNKEEIHNLCLRLLLRIWTLKANT